MLILWPGIIVLLLILAAQAFLVAGARAQAEAAASSGLRAAWASVGDAGLAYAQDGSLYVGADPHPDAMAMAVAAHEAVAQVGGANSTGWRWWAPSASVVRSDWCHGDADLSSRPGPSESGWIRVEVTGEVVGPFSALWPGRLDRVHAAAAGPAVLTPTAPMETTGLETAGDDGDVTTAIPRSLPEC